MNTFSDTNRGYLVRHRTKNPELRLSREEASRRAQASVKSNVVYSLRWIQTSGMGLHDVLLDFSFRAVTGTAVGFAVIVFAFLSIPRRSENKLARPALRSR